MIGQTNRYTNIDYYFIFIDALFIYFFEIWRDSPLNSRNSTRGRSFPQPSKQRSDFRRSILFICNKEK